MSVSNWKAMGFGRRFVGNSRCIGWARATVSLWGRTRRFAPSDLIKLSDEVPVRLRYEDFTTGGEIISDRELDFKTKRRGFHTVLRFYFKPGEPFFEQEIIGIRHVEKDGTARVTQAGAMCRCDKDAPRLCHHTGRACDRDGCSSFVCVLGHAAMRQETPPPPRRAGLNVNGHKDICTKDRCYCGSQ